MIKIKSLEWDAFNVSHIAKHDVTVDEVEEVCMSKPHFTEAKSNRLRAIGETSEHRVLTIILADKGNGGYYTVSARSASRKERKLLIAARGGEAV